MDPVKNYLGTTLCFFCGHKSQIIDNRELIKIVSLLQIHTLSSTNQEKNPAITCLASNGAMSIKQNVPAKTFDLTLVSHLVG